MNRSQNISKEPEQKASRTPKQGTKGSPHGFEKEVDEYRNDCIVKKKIRIALFGSFYKGFFMLSECLNCCVETRGFLIHQNLRL